MSNILRNSIDRAASLCSSFTIALLLACFALFPKLQGQLIPAPDGCYPNFTTAEGCDALSSLTTGVGNTALGWRSLFLNTDASFNTGVGGGALALNNGSSNTAVGAAALLLNTTASNATAVGTDALVNNAADGNTAVGFFALQANTIGGTLETSVLGALLGPNTAVGSHALENNVDGSANTAVGYNALHSQVSGYTVGGDPHLAGNTAVGFEALLNVTGTNNALNTALGYLAFVDLLDGDSNVAVGAGAGIGLASGTSNIFIGDFVGPATASESEHTYIGNIIFTSLPTGGDIDSVTIDLTSGLLGHNSSSQRYKEDIQSMDQASEVLYRLKPVTYRLKKEIDKHHSRAFGLIAEEVAEVNPDLIARNAKGEVEGVHYEMVNAMLLNEFLKEHRKNEKQEAMIARQQKQLDALSAAIQKVSAQLQLSKSPPQTVTNE